MVFAQQQKPVETEGDLDITLLAINLSFLFSMDLQRRPGENVKRQWGFFLDVTVPNFLPSMYCSQYQVSS